MSTSTHPRKNSLPSPAASASERATSDEREYRLSLIGGWLLEGKPRHEVQRMVRDTMFVSLRTAQMYVQEVQQRLAIEVAEEEELFHLRLSQHQRDQLMHNLIGYTQVLTQVDPKVLRSFTELVKAACKLLDGRNATARQIQELVAQSGRLSGAGNPARPEEADESVSPTADVAQFETPEAAFEPVCRENRVESTVQNVAQPVGEEQTTEEDTEGHGEEPGAAEPLSLDEAVFGGLTPARESRRARRRRLRELRRSPDLIDDFVASVAPHTLPAAVPAEHKVKPDMEMGLQRSMHT